MVTMLEMVIKFVLMFAVAMIVVGLVIYAIIFAGSPAPKKKQEPGPIIERSVPTETIRPRNAE